MNIDKTIEFCVKYKEEEICGYMFLDECDDEKPLRFYSINGSEQLQIPSNPYKNPTTNLQMMYEEDYDILTDVICSCEMFVQYLVDFQDEHKKIILDTINKHDILLIIN